MAGCGSRNAPERSTTRVFFASVGASSIAASAELAETLRSRGIRVEVDDSGSRMQNKIRLAQEQKVPYMLILGDREVEARAATLRRRGADRDAAQETLEWGALAERFAAEAATRRVE